MTINKIRLAFVVLVTFILGGFALAEAPQISNHFERALQGHADFTSEEREALGKFHFVFITGYLNEKIDAYYAEPLRMLSEAGATASRVNTRSVDTVEENAAWINENLRKLHADGGGKPLVVLAHSNGGVAGLLAVVQNPDLMREGKVQQLMTLQSPLRGAPATDNTIAIDRAMGAVNWLYASMNDHKMRGIRSFESTRLQGVFKSAIGGLSPEDRATLSENIFYISSEKAKADMPVAFRVIQMGVGDGANDGLIPTEAMGLEGFGQTLRPIPDADHMELVKESKTAKAKPFLRALVGFVTDVASQSVTMSASRCAAALRVPGPVSGRE